MNYVLEEILAFKESVNLAHYGTKRHSGRYPWGSGENPYQHSGDLASRIQKLRSDGISDTDIAKQLGFSSTTELRTAYRVDKNQRRVLDVETAKSLREKGYSPRKIAEIMGVPYGTVRSFLNEKSEALMLRGQNTADMLKKAVEEKGFIDVGTGIEKELGISRDVVEEALVILEQQGYEVYGAGLPQVTNPGMQINQMVLCPPGTEHREIFDPSKIHSLEDYISRDGGVSYEKPFHYPESLDSSRLQVVYAEEGGIDKDGLIELRRGVEDISLGESNYAQVRVLVDGTHYLKGMAVYSDDLPDGVDIRFNTNKPVGTPALGDGKATVLKQIKDDPDNPFGALIKEKGGQRWYEDENGEKHLSLINKTREEGEWTDWSDTLPAQFLSKQNKALVEQQLNLSIADREKEYEDILAITNPTVKKNQLMAFASDCDSTAVHLNAAALPRQRWHVIIPEPTMRDNEVYAPGYEDGEQVALVRYPHGGTFEIPILTVNNSNPNAKGKVPKTSMDAVCINKKIADQLSGADFDGDTVMLIPTNDPYGKVKISSKKGLDELQGFDPKIEYAYHDGMKVMSKGATQKQMGEISNLITDMTIIGATDSELARAVKHSMVVIDAAKHKLDYEQSFVDNDIQSLKDKYQGHYDDDGTWRYGAATIVSRAKSQVSVNERQGNPHIDKETGELIYKESGRTKVKKEKDGTYTTTNIPRTEKSDRMSETDDAYTLVSKYQHPVELLYAEYANKMKALANDARKEYVSTKERQYDPNAAKVYAAEVEHLTDQLNVAKANAPREREAQRMANTVVEAKKQDNPEMSKKDVRKAASQALADARYAIGAKRTPVEISEREWEAIQAGAVSSTTLSEILRFAKPEVVSSYAMPRQKETLTPAKESKIKAMSLSNYTVADIAKAVGLSETTVYNVMSGKID